MIGVPSPARDAVGQLLHADTHWDYDDRITRCDVGWLSHHRAGASASHRFHSRNNRRAGLRDRRRDGDGSRSVYDQQAADACRQGRTQSRPRDLSCADRASQPLPSAPMTPPSRSEPRDPRAKGGRRERRRGARGSGKGGLRGRGRPPVLPHAQGGPAVADRQGGASGSPLWLSMRWRPKWPVGSLIASSTPDRPQLRLPRSSAHA